MVIPSKAKLIFSVEEPAEQGILAELGSSEFGVAPANAHMAVTMF